jgi:hypothetical protein
VNRKIATRFSQTTHCARLDFLTSGHFMRRMGRITIGHHAKAIDFQIHQGKKMYSLIGFFLLSFI